MRRSAIALALALAAVASVGAVASVAPAAKTPPRRLPPASFSIEGRLDGLAAAGSRVAVAADCDVWVAALGRGTKPKTPPVRMRGLPFKAREYGCDDPASAHFARTFVPDGLWLGRQSVVVEILRDENTTGTQNDEHSSLWKATLPSEPLRQVGNEWSFFDDSGCAARIVAGGGVIATMRFPKGRPEPGCPASGTTAITLDGAARARTTVQGSWYLLATDGKRLLLKRNGELSLVGLDGQPLATPEVAPAVVKATFSGWLVPEGLVLRTPKGIVGPRWTMRGGYSLVATVGYGRVLYVRGNVLRVRRIRDGVDRQVLTLPKPDRMLVGNERLIAAGSLGVAVAIQYVTGEARPGDDTVFYGTSVYRIGWSVIDTVSPQR